MMLENDRQAFHELPFCLMTDFFWWNRLHSQPLPPQGEQLPFLSLLPSHTFTCVCYHWPLKLSAEAVRTANTQRVSTSKKEQLSPSSPQHCDFMIPLFFIWLNPHGGALCFQPAHCWLPSTGCAQTLLCPQPQITPSLRGDLPSLKGPECPMSPVRIGWWFRQSGGKQEEVSMLPREGREFNTHTHFRMEADCPATSSPDSSQHSSSSFVRKKSQMFRDAGTARTRQQLQSGITFLDFCAWHSLLALSWVP